MRLLLFAIALSLLWSPLQARTLTVFAAASLSDVMQAIADELRETRGLDVRHSFASSSVLARQIMAGAPADIFVSANTAWMDAVEERGLTAAGTRRNVAGNRLALIAPTAETREIELSYLPDLLGERDRLSIGDPDHVPAGLYARQALTALGIWDALEPRLAPSDNVRGALALAARGETPFGIVYESDARISDRVRIVTMIDADLHDPIVYPAAAISGAATDEGMTYLAFLTSSEGQAIFVRFGFLPIHDEPAS